MGVPLNGYRTTRLLRSSGNSRVYEAVRESDGLGVVAKVFDLEADDIEARVEHEFSLIQALDVDGVVEALGLQRVGNQLVLLLERVRGRNLAEYSQRQPVELERFFAIAIQVADILGRIHARRVIHRDIKPTNLLIDDESGRVFVADFGISVLLDVERRHIYDPAVLEGTLPYISPEQTGRTGRAVDFRSDLYSLGVTFYELLTGRRPFEFSAPLELIHAHLARIPEPPSSVRPEVPDGLERVVMRLLAKAPEHRYQTAAGLAADLRKLRELFELGQDGRRFTLGREDFPRTLQLPHQLYGRTQERHELTDELERVIRNGVARLLLLAGPPGIGKSALLADFEGPVAGFGGYLVRGKFDAFRELPYAGFVEAFTALVEQLLTESDERLTRWRERLNHGLGGVGRVICELVPRLELVLGPQPRVPALAPHEARNRLHLAIGRFLSACCEDEQPLVLVLDDLQWADRSSLALLRALLDGGRRGSLLIVGSFREDEVGPGRAGDEHPLRELIDALADQHRLRITRVRPLDEQAVAALLSDTLCHGHPASTAGHFVPVGTTPPRDAHARPSAEVRRLAHIVSRKTGNNPLFIRQFLTHVSEAGLLRPGEHGWTWDEPAIEAATIPDDVLGIMTAKLAGLSDAQRELLAEAACIGSRFDLATLEAIQSLGVIGALGSLGPHADPAAGPALAQTLYELVELGLLAPVGREYRFAHDRLHDAALEFSTEQRRQQLRWAIGRHALAPGGELPDERLFGVVDHLDAGLASATLDDALRLQLADLNLRAGTRALDAAAYDAALRYLDVGLQLIERAHADVAARGPEAEHHQLVFRLAFARAQTLALARRHEAATAAFDELLAWPLASGDYGRVAARRVRLLFFEDRPHEAVALGLASLERCGYPITRDPSRLRVGATLVRAWLAMRGYTTEDLLALRPCTDERIGAVMEIAAETASASYVVDPRMLILMIGLQVRLLLGHGFHPHTPVVLTQLAMGVGPGLGKIPEALKLCEQALALIDRSGLAGVRPPVEAGVYLFVWHLGRPFAEPIARLDGAYERALESGDFEYTGIMGALGLGMHIEIGTHLRVVERLSRRLEDDIGRWSSAEMVVVAWMIRAFAVALGGRDVNAAEDSDVLEAFNPEVVAKRGGSRASVYAAHVSHAHERLLMGDDETALERVLVVFDDLAEVMLGSWLVPRAALVLVVAGGRVLHERQSLPPRVSKAMGRARKMLARNARGCFANYGHYQVLAEGVFAELRGHSVRVGGPRALGGARTVEIARAMRLYERARVLASEQCCRWVEGLAAEQLAGVAEREQLLPFARGARAQAWAAYAAWGANAKLEQLGVEFDEFAELTERDRSVNESTAARRATRMHSGPYRAIGSSSASASASSSGSHRSVAVRSSATSAEALDFESVLQAVRVMTEDLRLDEVIARVLEAAIANAGADRGMLLLERDEVLTLVAEAVVDGERQVFEQPLRLSEAEQACPVSLVNFVMRTGQALVIDDARTDPRFQTDPYVVRTSVQSLLAMPIVRGKRQLGMLVLENRLSAYCFTPERLEGLALIAGQAASALENARLYTMLRRSEARWRSLVDGAPDLIALLNEHGEVEFVNRSSLTELADALRSEAASGRLLEMFMSPTSAEQWREAVALVLREGVQHELEIEVVRDQGPPRWYVARLAPIEFEAEVAGEGGSSKRHAVAVATDITERRRAEFARHQLEAQLRQQQRLESVGTLASGVAHEINNPVQGILNYAELINENIESPALIREFAHEITTESNRVATIVRNLLQFSRQERETRMEDAEIAALVDGTLSLIRAVLRKDHIQVEVAIPDGLPKLRVRVQQIQQILMNLVTNARDALNEVYKGYDARKVIELRAEPLVDANGKVTRVRIIVEDHGPGIAADVLPRVFDPFFTTKGRDQGTGLGLSVSHGIAQDHGGDLSVETKHGEWTRFRLDLPCGQ